MDNTILCIFGRKGSGKSFLAKQCLDDWDRVLILDLMAEYPGDVRTWTLEEAREELIRLCGRERWKLSATGLAPYESLALLDLAREIPGLLVVVEEAGTLCSPSDLPPELAELVYRGRHYGVSLLVLSQRPATVHRGVTSQADLVVAFRQHEQRDIAYLRSLFGDSAEELRYLEEYEVRVYGDTHKAPVALLARLP